MTNFICKNCATQYELEDSLVGQVLHCRKCGIQFRILQVGDNTSIAYLKNSKPVVREKSSVENVEALAKKPVLKKKQEEPIISANVETQQKTGGDEKEESTNTTENRLLGIVIGFAVITSLLVFAYLFGQGSRTPRCTETYNRAKIYEPYQSEVVEKQMKETEEKSSRQINYELQHQAPQTKTKMSEKPSRTVKETRKQKVENVLVEDEMSVQYKPSPKMSGASTRLDNELEGLLSELESTNELEPKSKNIPVMSSEERYKLGLSYEEGRGVKKNIKKAFSLFEEAAIAGHMMAQYKLASFYYSGTGVAKNYRNAVKWFIASANQGCAPAQHCLGVCYANGQGVVKNEELATEWYGRAARRGYMWAQYNLGVRYEKGRGVSKNLESAIHWFEKSASQGYKKAREKLREFYTDGPDGRVYTKKGIEWLIERANQGNVSAQASLGRAYYYGIGTSKNDVEAYRWLTRAAIESDYVAQVILHKLKSDLGEYENQIIDAFEKGAALGYYNAKTLLGIYLLKMDKSDETYSKVIRLWKTAAEEKDPKAMYHLGLYYSKGVGFWGKGKDIMKAVEYWRRAYALGDVWSAVYLGDYYKDRDDLVKAKECYLHAAKNGDKSAMRELGEILQDSVYPAERKVGERWIQKSKEN